MNTETIRSEYLKFFTERGHKVIKRAPLVLQGDPTTLFTGSGMQPIIPYLLGEPHVDGKRLVDSQTCLRAQDIDDIGDNRHTTFFEMLGNWSLGDYFKQQQIEWMFEFLDTVVGLDMSKLYVTCFIGAPEYEIEKDTEAANVWKKLFEAKGLPSGEAEIGSEEEGYSKGIKDGERIFYYDGSKNWWSRNGAPESTPIGDPCGPDSEMFYLFDSVEHNTDFGEFCHPNCDCGRFMEIGNNVFMAYRKVADGKFEKLEYPNIDHGSGLERIAAAKLNDPDVYKISLMWPIIEKLQSISGKKYEDNLESMRVIADHLRAATFLAVDGCIPSNKEQGYVMRRLLRRAIRFAFDLGIEQNFLEQVVPVIADLYHNDFPEVAENRDSVIATLVKEEKSFRNTLRKGLKEFDKIADQKKDLWTYEDANDDEIFEDTKYLIPEPVHNGKKEWIKIQGNAITGKDIFLLQDTYGFPWPLSVEEATNRNIAITKDWATSQHAEMEEQRNRSRTAVKGEFKGGLGGDALIHKKYHTATHLLQSALRELFGDQVRQHGSNITEERLRFDFSLDHKMTPEEIAKAEELVNSWIQQDLPVWFTMYPTQEALDMGAIGPFGERYGDSVKVYQMGKDAQMASLEICGGPHVDHTGQLAEDGKVFKIVKEEASSAGIRRIKAALV
ncbi:MAG: alaS [Candidatus Saccharibacteria bacterium]|nr:alaS [Candidatus Saccharibacteria bacterium]